MCFIMAIAPLKSGRHGLTLRDVLPEGLDLVDANQSPMGQALIGKTLERDTFFVLAGECSCDLVKGDKPDQRALQQQFVAGIKSLVRASGGLSLAVHWADTEYWLEPVDLGPQVVLNIDEFAAQYPALAVDRPIVIETGGTLRG